MPEHTPDPDVHDMIGELTRHHIHREPYSVQLGHTRWQRHHRSSVPPLVHQLLNASPSSSGAETGSGPVSKPAARIESIDTLILIDHEAGEWLDRLGETIPADRIDPDTQRTLSGSGTTAALAKLHVAHTQTTRCDRARGRHDDTGTWCCTWHDIEDDVRRWWRQARIITGWDSPAYRPFNTCPVCEHRGGLRINLELQAGFCIECRSTWGREEIGLLADHIRGENLDDDTDTPTDISA